MKHKNYRTAYRVRATAIIWGLSIVMLGICIPIIAINKSGVILPLAVIIVAGLNTASVWESPKPSEHKTNELQDALLKLETRIIDLETICSYLELEQKGEFKHLDWNE